MRVWTWASRVVRALPASTATETNTMDKYVGSASCQTDFGAFSNRINRDHPAFSIWFGAGFQCVALNIGAASSETIPAGIAACRGVTGTACTTQQMAAFPE